ncbi:MAG TPA: type VI secretion system lipoprotein TssJ [Acetobacteraceae bacterium]|nr:type VI secretion system lipoprotein TssJ [Acetobacteraceae bacterium]
MKRRALLLMLPLALATCGGPKPPPPAVLDLTIIGGATQNPETDGHPAPVSIRIYQLGAAGGFQQADIFALLQRETATLGQDLLGAETLTVTPGQTLHVHRQLKPGTQFLGAAVLFRDIDHAQWRGLAPVAASGPTALTLKTDKLSMTLSP